MTSTPEGGQDGWANPSGGGPGSWGAPPPVPGQVPPPAQTPPPGPVPPVAPPAGQAPYGGPDVAAMAMRESLRPGIVPLRPLSFGEILDGAFRAVRFNPRVMFGLTAVVVVVAVVVQSLLQWYVQGLIAAELLGTADALGEDVVLTTTLAAEFAEALTSTPVLFVVTAILTGLLIVAVSRATLGQRVGPAEVWQKVRPRALALVGFSILMTVVTLAALALVVALVVAAVSNGAAEFAVLLGLLLLLAWFVTAVVVGVRLLLVPAVLVLEGQRLGAALSRSWQLTRGSFWRTLGVYVVVSIIVGVVTGAVTLPGQVLSLLAFPDALGTDPGPLLVNALTLAVSQTVTMGFSAAAVALVYIDQRMRKEGLDIQLQRAAAEQV